ncbi:hypothetical protein [Mycolicibacterium hippocampi]|uniref:hypothetical protein n=1 Tax=Mycolicibacterium hippocampi TaxID=659824 RepID=UPI0013CFDEBA|nr:hypothetical protein [Mycolicibacterium hippocampi]
MPRTESARGPDEQHNASSLARALRVPAGYSVVYFAAVVIYFTYASDAPGRADPPASPAW